MYESQKENSLWKPYFDILPREFDTPMFWNDDDLAELEGTGVIGNELKLFKLLLEVTMYMNGIFIMIDKIGKADMERQFNEYFLPIIQVKKKLINYLL